MLPSLGKWVFVVVWSQCDISHLKNCESGQFTIYKKKNNVPLWQTEARKGDRVPVY